MKVISTEIDFRPIELGIKKTISNKKILPEMVFKSPFRYFLFIAYDDLRVANGFFMKLKKYLENAGERDFWIATVEPDPRLYYKKHFDIFGVFEFSIIDSEVDYFHVLNHYPEENSPDSLMCHGDILVASSRSNKWAVYASWEDEIAICAFSDISQMELFKECYGSDLLDNVEGAAEFAYGQSGDKKKIEKLCTNYSTTHVGRNS